MASWTKCLEILIYIALLFFFIPVKINGPNEYELKFEEYLKTFNKTYNNSNVYQNKLEAFKKSLDLISSLNLNRTNNTAIFGLTKYSDMLPEEFLQNHLQVNLSQKIELRKSYSKSRTKRAIKNNIPEKIDWRDKKVISSVKNQRNCGACWAFSGVETIESMYAIKSGKLLDLSVQQIIDCAGYSNDGCNGGDICTLLSWMKDNNIQLQTEEQYPLNLKNNRCKLNYSMKGVQIDDYDCESFINAEDVILQILALNGPVAVAINAQIWQNYIGGVIKYHCSSDMSLMNHAVQIVGYDLTAKIPHYIVRNTWGEEFGDKGYLYIAIGENICGLANEVSALTVL